MSEFILERARDGAPMDDAVVEGGVSRFRQVVLTAVTTIIGLVPLTLGFHLDFQRLLMELRPGLELGSANTQFWGPLGSAVIWGLPAATAVTLLVVPIVFSATASLRRHGARWLGR
jgi:multidrug efflux pump